jgi:hypothetical protein
VYDPPPQTKYLQQPDNDTVATQGAFTLVGDTKGVAAYLIDNVEKGGLAAGTGALTAADANTIAAAVLVALRTGAAMTLAAVNALIAATAANSELTNGGGSASTGTLTDFLRILAGAEYTLAGGTVLEAAGTFAPGPKGTFDTGKYRVIEQTGAFNLSVNSGRLSQLMSSSFSYLGTTGAAVVIYDETGAVVV